MILTGSKDLIFVLSNEFSQTLPQFYVLNPGIRKLHFPEPIFYTDLTYIRDKLQCDLGWPVHTIQKNPTSIKPVIPRLPRILPKLPMFRTLTTTWYAQDPQDT